MTNKKNMIQLSVIIIVCLSCLTRVPIIAMIIAIPYWVIEKRKNHKKPGHMGIAPQNILESFKKSGWLILMPIASGVTAILLSKLILPDFYMHVIERTKPILVLDKLFVLFIQLLILALAEEVVFRGFLQAQISARIKPAYAIIITSFFFSIAHYSSGAISIVLYDLFFIFVDSILYGILYERTKSVYACWISHFLANAVGVGIVLLLV